MLREKQVSICTKDSNGAYHFEMVNELINVAKENGIKNTFELALGYATA